MVFWLGFFDFFMNDVCSSFVLCKRNFLFVGVWKLVGELLCSIGVVKIFVCLVI